MTTLLFRLEWIKVMTAKKNPHLQGVWLRKKGRTLEEFCLWPVLLLLLQSPSFFCQVHLVISFNFRDNYYVYEQHGKVFRPCLLVSSRPFHLAPIGVPWELNGSDIKPAIAGAVLINGSRYQLYQSRIFGFQLLFPALALRAAHRL